MADNHPTHEMHLIEAAKKGDAKAQKQIYETYAPLMLSVCLRYMGDMDTAKDLLQDGFIKLFAKLDTFAGTGAFAGWVRRVFVTTCLESLRQKTALKLSTPLDYVDFNLHNDDLSVVDSMSADEIMQLIAELPESSRSVFNLFVIEGYSHAEIAELIGTTEVNSRTLFLRARRMLQQAIEKIRDDERRNA